MLHPAEVKSLVLMSGYYFPTMRLDVPVMCGVGAAFDFHAGRVPQAPRWMQERGLEWIYRTLQEPRRLLGRYLSTNPRFVAAFARQYLGERRRKAG